MPVAIPAVPVRAPPRYNLRYEPTSALEKTMPKQTTAEQLTITAWVNNLAALNERDFTLETVQDYIVNHHIRPETLDKYLFFSKGSYTRNLIFKNQLFECMAICWEVGQASRVHNHRDQNCWMAVPIGKLLVENYRVVFEDSAAGTCKLETADTVEMNPSDPCAVDPKQPVHRVLNPRHFAERAVSLHVYSRPFDTCVVYSPENGTCGEIKLHFNTRFGKAVQD